MAPPECPDDQRLGRALCFMADQGQSLPSDLARRLERHQHGRELRFGAWLGGREGAGSPRLKLYAELAEGADLASILPDYPVVTRLSSALQPRMLGIEPSRQRIEAYFRLLRFNGGSARLLVAGARPTSCLCHPGVGATGRNCTSAWPQARHERRCRTGRIDRGRSLRNRPNPVPCSAGPAGRTDSRRWRNCRRVGSAWSPWASVRKAWPCTALSVRRRCRQLGNSRKFQRQVDIIPLNPAVL